MSKGRRIVVEKGYAKRGEYFQTVVVYPTHINMKQVERENKGITTKVGVISFENKNTKYTEVSK